MKQSDIQHILDNGADPPVEEKILTFTHRICDDAPYASGPVVNQPESWDNVRHITGKLFYAWDRHAPEHGAVFLGEFR